MPETPDPIEVLRQIVARLKESARGTGYGLDRKPFAGMLLDPEEGSLWRQATDLVGEAPTIYPTTEPELETV
jgi:hypothetical protein